MSETILLKARLFDAQESVAQLQNQNKEFVQALSAIAQVVGLTEGDIQLQAVVDAVRSHVEAEPEQLEQLELISE